MVTDLTVPEPQNAWQPLKVKGGGRHKEAAFPLKPRNTLSHVRTLILLITV